VFLTEAQQGYVVQKTANALSNFQDGQDAKQLLTALYCQNMEDKSPRQGRLMARELIDWMERFQSGYDMALEDASGYARRELSGLLEGQSFEQQCTLLRSVIRTMDRMDPDGSAPSAGGSGPPEPCPGPAGPETRDKLLDEAVKRVCHSGLPQSAAQLPEPSAPDSPVLMTYMDQNLLRAVTAMIIYTMVKNNQPTPLPPDTRMSQAAVAVCAADTRRQIGWNARQGYLSEAEAEEQLSALNVVFNVLLVLTAAAAISTVIPGGVLRIGFAAAAAVPLLLFAGAAAALVAASAEQMLREDSQDMCRICLDLDSRREVPRIAPSAPELRKHESWAPVETNSGAARAAQDAEDIL